MPIIDNNKELKYLTGMTYSSLLEEAANKIWPKGQHSTFGNRDINIAYHLRELAKKLEK